MIIIIIIILFVGFLGLWVQKSVPGVKLSGYILKVFPSNFSPPHPQPPPPPLKKTKQKKQM